MGNGVQLGKGCPLFRGFTIGGSTVELVSFLLPLLLIHCCLLFVVVVVVVVGDL